MIGNRKCQKSSALLVIAALASVLGGCLTDFGPPTATFNGTSCSYEGLPGFTPGESVTFTFDNRSDGEAGVGIVKLVDGTSIGDLNAEGIDAHTDSEGEPGVGMAASGESTYFEFRFSIGGDWLVYCFGDGDYPAAIVEVSGSPEPGL